MKPEEGMYIGMGTGKDVSLLVGVTAVDGSAFIGKVINGNWSFVYDTDTKLMTFDPPFGARVVTPCNILFTAPLPQSVRYADYNEIIQYMNDTLERHEVVLWVLRVKHSITSSVTGFYKRVKTSSQAFVRTWKQGSTKKHVPQSRVDDDLDDDIPF